MFLTPTRFAAAAVEDISVPALGPDTWNKTYYPKGRDTVNTRKQWFIIDAEGQTLGRLATLAATHIRGKTSPMFSPSMDMGEPAIFQASTIFDIASSCSLLLHPSIMLSDPRYSTLM